MNYQKWSTYGVHPNKEDSSYKYYQRMNFQKGGLSKIIEKDITKDNLMQNEMDIKFHKFIEKNDKIQYIPWENTPRVWWNDYRGCITKSILYPGEKIIKQDGIPYNQPENFIDFLDEYFKCDLR
jgi:hypothetical protein